ncbi:uncharacterized protein LOC130986979 [Salvia miltiorrhiza]|uniref:uncharacterized protein LOC130986979 n=1 Tax=Salvia miltiorrhiza TaxID=226208 RepID=UPI0025AB73EC|nr:uncharacterized protein LOC130986979 [Salvia miltiorrhiza]
MDPLNKDPEIEPYFTPAHASELVPMNFTPSERVWCENHGLYPNYSCEVPSDDLLVTIKYKINNSSKPRSPKEQPHPKVDKLVLGKRKIRATQRVLERPEDEEAFERLIELADTQTTEKTKGKKSTPRKHVPPHQGHEVGAGTNKRG